VHFAHCANHVEFTRYQGPQRIEAIRMHHLWTQKA
jgi:hypothetical protein